MGNQEQHRSQDGLNENHLESNKKTPLRQYFKAIEYAQKICFLGASNTVASYHKTGGWAQQLKSRYYLPTRYVKDEKNHWKACPQTSKQGVFYEVAQKPPEDFPIFLARTQFSVETRIGNCEDMAYCAARYLWEFGKNIQNLKIVKMLEVDHVFVLVHQEGEKQPWIVDPFQGIPDGIFSFEDHDSSMRHFIKQYDENLKQLKSLGIPCRRVARPKTCSLDFKVLYTINPQKKPYPKKEVENIGVNVYTTDIRDNPDLLVQYRAEQREKHRNVLKELKKGRDHREPNQRRFDSKLT